MKKAVILPVLLTLCACTGQISDTGSSEQSLVIKGSDTEVQLVSNLAEAFIAAYPGSDISVTGGGSATGIASIINGEADIANSSRQMSEEEQVLAAEHGITVSEFILANDGLSVIVHRSNPVTELTLEQIGKIFSGEITNWDELGGPSMKIVLYGRQSTSGTYGFFRDTVVKSDYARSDHAQYGRQPGDH
jgi:phosphate transport system substrate-binding protein